MELIILVFIGILAGSLSGLIGIGGATITIPALILFLGYSQKLAQGTSLFVLAFPIALIPAINYYKAGFVNIKSSLIILLGFILSSYIASKFAVKLDDYILRKLFSVFLISLGIFMYFK